uniref:FHF complex subunit HOOK-interacting protein 1B n=1 Tax=Seriola lalandi dorsalis TaxID=1841481 RepID=A0A3B4Z303_SERLL
VESMSWLSRLNPRGPGSRSGRSAAPSSPCTADPETCLMVFENHWRQVSWVLEQHEPSSSSDDLTAVRNHTDQMLCLLAEERPADSSEGGASVPPMGPILELVVTENILECLVQWHLRRGLDPDSQGALLKLFEMLIGQSQQPLLQHTAILHPLLRLLGACADPELGCPSALENSLVLLLNQVCVTMARQPVVLEMLFRAAPAQQGSTNLLIFSLLVPFIHRDGAIGQQARDALLLVMAASASHEAVARYIAENSYFCPVLATGLSALYSSLPRKIEVRGDDWHALRREDWMNVSSLVLFMNSLEFCNAVVQVAHPLVRYQLLDYLHNGFLVPVMGPALHKSSVDEMIASTAYLDLFLRSVTETSLLKTFLRFILLHCHDNDTILDTLLTRISSNSRLCMVSLSLFRTLLSLHCEDIMLQLVLRYLLPCTHVMLSQRRAIRETDIYGKSADKFLSLIPECCRLSAAPSADRDEDNAFWAMNSPSTESPAPPRPSTPSRLAFFIRQQSSGGGSGGGGSPTPTSMEPQQSGPASPMSPDSPMHQQQTNTECLEWDSGYLEYLKDARRDIELCSWACRDWSAPYDGENPSPNTAPPPPPPPTSNPSMAMFPEHFSLQQGGNSNTPPGQQRAAPGDSQLSGDSNGQGISIEAFTQELRELEDRVKERSRAALQQEETARESLTAERQEEEQQLSSALEAKLTGDTKAEGPVVGVCSPARPLNQPASQPYTGPFMVVLFAKLENMLQNSLYVNILLTGIVAQLACYPQPLLRSFLLNTNMVFQPSVKSLIQVLGSVKNRIEAFAASHEDFPAMLKKAQQYLVARGKVDWSDSPAAVPTLRRSDSLVKSRKPSLGDLILRHTNSPTRARHAAQLALAHVRDGSQSLHSALFRGGAGGGASGLEKQAEALRVKNAVYCAVVFCEFLKELAALAQEHAVTLPFPHSQEDAEEVSASVVIGV